MILALSRAVSEEEYHALAAWVLDAGRGQLAAPELKNPRRSYFLPARATGYEARANLVDLALDIDTILHSAELDEQTAAEQAEATAPRPDLLEQLFRTSTGVPKPSLYNLVTVLDGDDRWRGRLARCEFSRRDLLDGQPMTDSAEVEVGVWLNTTYGIDAGVERIHQAAGAVCARHPMHPVREYLEGLVWDEEPRLEAWLDYAGCLDTDDGLSTAFGTKWMISAVARIFVPGCQPDSVLILAGAQGFGKTSTFRLLAGLEHHSETALQIGQKDSYQQLNGVWIYELGELDSLRRSEMTAVKNYITTRQDKYRPSYGRNDVHVLRQTVFGGTTNDVQFLPEAGRRWWVRQVVRPADLHWLERHRDQLWAEAVHRFRAGEKWWLEGDEKAAQEVDVEAFRHVDPWEEPIRTWLAGRTYTTTPEILTQALKKPPEQQTRGDAMRVAELLKQIGFEPRRSMNERGWQWPWGASTH